jgi:hypothetical protein
VQLVKQSLSSPLLKTGISIPVEISIPDLAYLAIMSINTLYLTNYVQTMNLFASIEGKKEKYV